MRLYGYYALHSFVNQIRKLLKTWVLIFVLACALIGGLIGFGAGILSEVGEERSVENAGITAEVANDTEETAVGAEVIADSQAAEEGIAAGDAVNSGNEDTLDETGTDEEFAFEINGKDARYDLIELIVGGIVLAVFLFELVGADKSGSRIFLPADVNLLFASPMKPQSVLMFRLMTQIGVLVISSIYVICQLPGLMLSLGLGVRGAAAIILVWIFTLVIGKLLQVLFYTLAATHTGTKPYLRRSVYALVIAVAAAYFIFSRPYGSDHFTAAAAFFNHRLTRWIPFWGWLKGLCMFAIMGKTLGALLCFAALLAGSVALALVIWSIKADFYEDAMAKSEETAELLEVTQAEKSTGFVKRKKDRSEKIRRDGMRHGSGANVFFFRSLYNRIRFAPLGIFTKTADFYLFAAALAAAICCYLQGGAASDGFLPVILTLSALAFWRTLGNPLEEDTSKDFFRMIPESTEKKLLWSVLAGTVNCLLDLIPALILTEVVFRGNPLYVLAWVPFILSVDFYGTTTGAFINLSVPVSAGKLVKQVVQVMFVYFGLLPDVAAMAIGIVFEQVAAAAVIAAVINFGLGAVFLALTPLFVDAKDKPARQRAARDDVFRGIRSEDMIVKDAILQNDAEDEWDSSGYQKLRNGEDDTRIRARKTFSALGFGCFAILVIASVLQIACAILFPEWISTSWGLWVYTFVPMYVIAVPVGLLIFRCAPAYSGIMHRDKADTPADDAGNVPESEAEKNDANIIAGKYDIPDESIPTKENMTADKTNNAENGKKSGGSNRKTFPMKPAQIVRAVFISIFLMYAGNLIGNLVTTAISALTGTSAEAAITTYALADSLVLKILILVILGPLIEEYVFRKQLIDRMSCYGERLAVFTSALMFGLFHGNFTQLFYAFALGLLFGYIYLKTGKLRYSAGLHMGINFLGSIVPSALLHMLDMSALESLESLETLSPEALTPLLSQLALYGAYVILLLVSAITGLVLLCRGWRRVSFEQAELELPKGAKFRTVYGNAGMIAFVLGCAALMVLSVFG